MSAGRSGPSRSQADRESNDSRGSGQQGSVAVHPHIPVTYKERPLALMRARAEEFYRLMDARRSIRSFSERPVPRTPIEKGILTASTAPSGAHRQPWRFVAVSDPALKKRIREAAEQEEYASYHGRMPPEWLAALAPLGTDWRKPFLETAPWIVVCFAEIHGFSSNGAK